MLWIDGDRVAIDRVNRDLREASDAFDLAYNKSDTWEDMDRHVSRTIRALRRVQNVARNQQIGEG